MHLGIARLAGILDRPRRKLMIPPSTASAAAEAIGCSACRILFEGELFRGREHPPDIREMLGARN
jgi:hypothetical protein